MIITYDTFCTENFIVVLVNNSDHQSQKNAVIENAQSTKFTLFVKESTKTRGANVSI